MFRLISLQLHNHPFLGDLSVDFSTNEDVKSSHPYSTVIIGPNGTGKSEILRIVTNIFRTLYENTELLESNKGFNKELNLSRKDYVKSRYSIKYLLDEKEYFYTNKRNVDKFNKYDNLGELQINEKTTHFSQIKLPSTVIASVFLLNDKFVFSDNLPNHIYKYLGLRSSPGSSGTQAIQKMTVNNIVHNLDHQKFIFSLSELLQFLGYSKSLKIIYAIRYREHIFNGELVEKSFERFFNSWRESRNRKTEPFSISYYRENIARNKDIIKPLLAFINVLAINSQLNEKGKDLKFDVFEDSTLVEKEEFLDILVKLDLLRSPRIELEKQSNYSLNDSSSGEYHFIISMIGLLANIQNNSLICIDEPDISLHPNWQMKYINFLKRIFKGYPSCQFIIASHSHFMVSDLEPSSSYLVGLKRDTEGKIKAVELPQNTYGWSAENILYSIFNVRTTRNYYFEQHLREILRLISEKSNDIDSIKLLYKEIEIYKLDEMDPLNIILDNVRDYIINAD
ncbi:MAG: AAA family ATPase [Melioribacteraceae bacterium]